MSTVAFVAACFLGGLAGGLDLARDHLEADATLAELDDPATLRGNAGDRVLVHGRVVDRRIETSSTPTATTFTYLVALEDGTARREFVVPGTEYDRLGEGRWIVLPLAWDAGEYVAEPPARAVQPWTVWASGSLAAVALVVGLVSRLSDAGVGLARRGDVVELYAGER